MMLDAKRLLDTLTSDGAAGGFIGGLAAGALTSLLANKNGRKMAGSGLKVGGLAVVGGLAYRAYQRYRQANGVAVADVPRPDDLPLPPQGSGFLPDPDDRQGESSLSVLVLRAMIAAAKVDGQIDARENEKIFAELARLELSSEERAFLLEEYSRPLDLNAVVAAVDSPQHAAEVYAASLLVITDTSSPADRVYLSELARRLDLDQTLVGELHNTVRDLTAA
jgi:uncharacterized membrane protein YebE (DUF533 family)